MAERSRSREAEEVDHPEEEPEEFVGSSAEPSKPAPVKTAKRALRRESDLQALARDFPQPVTAYALADRIFFGGDSRVAGPPDATPRALDDWLVDVQPLLAADEVPQSSAIGLGLALLDPNVAEAVGYSTLLAAVDSLGAPIESVLSEVGLARWLALAGDDRTDTLTDGPAETDKLGRRVFARVLALRLRNVHDAYSKEVDRRAGPRRAPKPRRGPIMLHLNGTWGSGKSSLSGFVRDELRSPTLHDPHGQLPGPWIVIEFNAWQHQRIAPPWWWLMNEVYSQGKHQLLRAAPLRWLRFRLYDVVWRLRKSWMVWAGLAAGAVFFGIMGLIVWRVTAHKDPSTALKTLAAIATPLAAILGVGTTLWGITRGLQNWLLVHSAEGARSGLTKACDPLALVRDRFEGLVRNLALPVAVIIDDLDRCQPTYVVELLEGIQTLFAGAPVAYIVAADGRWLRDSFEEVYKTFLDMPSELGRPLGYQFTEKTFQLSTKVPRMGTDSRRLYLGGLLGGEETQSDQPITPVTVQAAQARTFDDASAAVAAARTPEEEAAAIEQALVRTQSASIQKQTEHFLLAFDSLIESNPRTMKRLVNAYGMARDLELVEAGSAVSRGPRAAGELALWTILGLRWPLLAEHLEGSPGDVALIGADPVSTSVPVELQQLFADQDVVDVVRGVGVSAQLDEGAVRRLVRRPLAATPPPPPP